MAFVSKITRILVKTLKYVFILLVLFAAFVVIAINTESFQTWLAQRVASYYSEEFGAKVSIGKVRLSFIRSAELENIFMEDKSCDTLFFARSLTANVSGFNYNEQRLKIDRLELNNTKASLLKHKGEKDLNFQFLIDYFSTADTIRTRQGWKIEYGILALNNVEFRYRNDSKDTSVSRNMNFDNLYVSNINGEISGIRIINDTVYARVKGLTARERCGLVVKNLSAFAKVSSAGIYCKGLTLQTENSFVKGGLVFSHDSWQAYNDFIDKVDINANLIMGTHVNSKDIAFFAKELNDLDKEVMVDGRITGYVSALNGEKVRIRYGKNTTFNGDFNVTGLPDIKSTYLHFDVKELSSSKRDLETLPAGNFAEKKNLKIPADIGKLGVVTYKGKFDGFINDFTTYGIFKTAIGNLNTDLAIQIDTLREIVKYRGSIRSEQFNIGRLFDIDKLGGVSINSKIKGEGLALNKINAELHGIINGLAYNGYNYKNITINGNIKNKIFNGSLVSKDENADFDFSGKVDFADEVPDIDFISTVNKLNLTRLGFMKGKEEGVLSSQILITLKGNSIDNITGLVNFDNTIYKTFEKTFKLSTFDLQLDQATEQKKIVLTSNYANVAMEGKFNLSTINGAFNTFLNYYYPTYIPKYKGKSVYTDEFSLKVTIKKFNTLNELFFTNVMLSPGTVLDGKFDVSKRLLNATMLTDSARYNSIHFKQCNLVVSTQNNEIFANLSGRNINIIDSVRFHNFSIEAHSQDKTTQYAFIWDNKTSPKYAGDIRGSVIFDPRTVNLIYEKVAVTVNDSTWNMTTSNPSIIDSSGTVQVDPLVFVNHDQMVDIQGSLTNRPSDKLDFNFKNFDLYQLSPFLSKARINIKGRANGTLSLHNNLKNLAFSSNLGFTDLRLNDNSLGNGELKTEYNSTDKYLYIDGYTSLGFENPLGEKVRNLSFSGYYYLDKKEESLDISLDANPASLALLNPILKDILTIKTGLVTGKGKVTGTPDHPKIDGNFKIAKCELKVDYLNVTYALVGTIEILSDQIRFEEVKMTDFSGRKSPGSGVINGNIFHNSFKDMRVDFDINYNNLMVLNTLPSEHAEFYGKAFATGNAGIYGFFNDVKLEISAKTEKGTNFFIPLDGPSKISETSFIRFVSSDTMKKKEEKTRSAFSLDLALTATPDAEAQIIFDAKSGDIIKARGNGKIDLSITNFGKFDMFGDYVIASGEYLFTLENFITKKFEIQKGSTIKWSGNPYNADIDIAANYKQRASIAPLFPHDSTGTYKRRYPVSCKLYMKEKLLSPAITFGIELPSIDDNTRSKIASLLADEAELNRQVFSLLLLKSFVTPLQYSQGGGISAGSAFAANSSEMLSNRISGWLSGLTNQIDVGVNYRPGSDLSSDELDIALSKQLLNNRLSFDSNFGVNNNQTKNSTGLIGDVNIEYKLTEDGRYRVKGFNRSNDNTQLTTSGGPFTQGVGAFYREEFETWDDLYRRYISKVKTLTKPKDKKPEEKPTVSGENQ
jgi:hypothetical protein